MSEWIEPQQQERQHVSDAAWEALSYRFGLQKRDVANDHYRNGGVVVITVAEHDEWMTLREEVKMLRNELARCDSIIADNNRELERLRKGRDDGRVDSVVLDRGGASLCTVFQTLDHRLGLGMPDGEPVEPMSARSWKRGWM